jgi:threonyl-tRNA synthetase
LWDLERPLEKSCKLELLDFEHPEGIQCSSRVSATYNYFLQERRSFGILRLMYLVKLLKNITGAICAWAHRLMMDSSMRWEYLIGMHPSVMFSASLYMRVDRPVSNTDYPALEKLADVAVKEKQKFERLVVSKEKLLEMFHVRLVKLFKSDEMLIFEDSITNTKNI